MPLIPYQPTCRTCHQKAALPWLFGILLPLVGGLALLVFWLAKLWLA